MRRFDPGKVDIDAVRAGLASFEQLANEQAHLPSAVRLSLKSSDGLVVNDVVAVAIEWCKQIIAEAEAAQATKGTR